MDIQNIEKFSFLKKLWWLFLVISVIELLVIIVLVIEYSDGTKPSVINNLEQVISNSKAPKCPEDLSGILTYPFMKPEDISAIIPLGNINPPGHTSPVDHNYFETDKEGDINLYAPADSIITEITQISNKREDDTEFKVNGYLLSFLVCDGLELDLTEYQTLSEKIRKELEMIKPECKDGIFKDGHEGEQKQCYFGTSIEVKAGELLGTVRKIDDKFPFELWAANYNVEPRKDVNWEFYNDNRYAHIMCFFDLYSGDLKAQYYSKFGTTRYGELQPRTIEPLCGEVNQNIVGTIQGMWYYGTEDEKDLEFQGKGLAFLHDNIDPTIGEISIGGTIRDGAEVIYFEPKHSGLIDREPSEVTADGKIYCYNGRNNDSKVLVQLLENTNMNIEYQIGKCGNYERFKTPYLYQR